jgi:hypothetical protein
VDIERLVQSARLINVDDLADPDIPWPVCSSCQSDSCHLPPLPKDGHCRG